MKNIFLIIIASLLSIQLMGQATVSIQQVEGAVPGSGLNVPVTANFSSVTGGVSAFTFYISFDSNVFTFTGLANLALSGIEYSINGSNQIIVQCVGAQSNLNGKLFDLVFNYNGWNSAITFGDQSQVADKNANIVPTTFNSGYVHMVDATPALAAANVIANAGQTVDAAVTTTGFYNVAGFNIEIQLANASVINGNVTVVNKNAALTGDFTTNYQNGVIYIAWTKSITGGIISLANGSKLFDLQFSFAGGNSTVNFNTTYSKIFKNLPSYPPFAGVTFTNGSIVELALNSTNQTVNLGDNTSFGVTATGVSSYQWQVSTNGGANFTALTNTAPYSSVTTATMNITGAIAAMNGYKYRCVVQPGNVTSSAATLSVNPLTVNIKVILQGAFNGTNMNTILNTSNYLPKVQPYNSAPWNYSGTETVASIPNANVVDWVLVELRTGTASGTVVGKKAGFVLKNGSIVGLDGVSPLTFPTLDMANYYIVVRHRNHLAIMSSSAQPLNSVSTLYDFSTATSKAYGTNPMASLTGGVFGMWGGDINANGNVRFNGSNNDRTSLFSAIGNSVVFGYLNTDVNMNGNARFNGSSNDRTAIFGYVGNSVIISQVP